MYNIYGGGNTPFYISLKRFQTQHKKGDKMDKEINYYKISDKEYFVIKANEFYGINKNQLRRLNFVSLYKLVNNKVLTN